MFGQEPIKINKPPILIVSYIRRRSKTSTKITRPIAFNPSPNRLAKSYKYFIYNPSLLLSTNTEEYPRHS